MQEISFHEAFSLTRRKLSVAEIARKCGLPRQTVNGWDSLVNQPQKAKLDLFMAFYRRDVINTDYHSAINILAGRLGIPIDLSHRDGESWEAVWLPFFFSDDYFAPFGEYRRNKRGLEREEIPSWSIKGQDYDDFYRLWQSGRTNEILGLSLLQSR